MNRLSALLVLMTLATLAAAPVAAAAEPTFGPASATSTFNVSIDVTQGVTVPAGVARVEAVVRAGKGARTFLATIPTPAVGAATLRYSYETPSGALYPNTPVELGFRITFEDGRTADGPTTTVLYADDRVAWKTLEGTIVRVHWYEGSSSFGQRALDIGERAIEEASALLGVTETKPVDFFIYADRDKFFDMLGPGLQENVGGLAYAPIRTMFANIAPSGVDDPWVGVVVPHELTHLVFNTATSNPYHEPLHWLNEGLADYIAVGYDAGARSNVERAARTGDLMPLRALVGQFPSTSNRFSLAYDESVSAIDYMVRTHGQDALVSLIRSYADGISDDAAFTAALGVDTAAFEAGWLADLGVAEPVPFGPQPAPPGPIPPGWLAGPAPSLCPCGSAPAATAGPSRPGGGDATSGALLVIGIVVAGLLIVVGLVLVAARLARGQPLLPPMAPGSAERAAEPTPPADEPPPDEAEVAAPREAAAEPTGEREEPGAP